MIEGAQDVVAVLTDEGIAVVADGDRLRLPRVPDDDRPWGSYLGEAAGDRRAIAIAPARLVSEDPRTVLHLLRGTSRLDPVVPLADLDLLDEPDALRQAIALGIAEDLAPEVRPPERPAWYAAGWRETAEEWVDEQLALLGHRRTGPSEVVKLWSLSAVLRLPCSDEGLGAVYLKACCPWFGAEPLLTQLLARHAGDRVPEVVAVDAARSWLLMGPLPDQTASPVRAAAALAELQVTMAEHLAGLEAAGAPDRRAEATRDGLAEVVGASIELPQLSDQERTDATALLPRLSSQIEELAGLGMPYSVGHGDLHVGNVAAEGDRPVIYDWSDAAITFPVLDAVLLSESALEADREATLKSYARVWRRGYDEEVVGRALSLAADVNDAYQAISYEGIYRAQEPESRWEMRGVVASILRRLVRRQGVSA